MRQMPGKLAALPATKDEGFEPFRLGHDSSPYAHVILGQYAGAGAEPPVAS